MPLLPDGGTAIANPKTKIVFAVLVWIALGLRDPRVFRIAFQSEADVSDS